MVGGGADLQKLGVFFVFFLVKPSSYSRTTYTDGRGDDGKTPRRRREGLRAQPRATRVQRTRARPLVDFCAKSRGEPPERNVRTHAGLVGSLERRRREKILPPCPPPAIVQPAAGDEKFCPKNVKLYDFAVQLRLCRTSHRDRY